MYVEFKRRVVALLRVVEMNEEEDVGPDVMLLAYVMLEALRQTQSNETFSVELKQASK